MSVIAILYTARATRRDFRVTVVRRENCADVAAARQWFAAVPKSNTPEVREEVVPFGPELDSNAAVEQFLHAQNYGRWHKGKSLLSPG
jgi:hypothetical protein